MTTQRTHEPMTEAEVRSFAAKSQEWWEGLTVKERTACLRLFQAAGAEGDDVRGHSDLGYAFYQLFMEGNALPALVLAVNAFQPQPPPAPTGPSSGGSLGGSVAGPRRMN